MWLVENTFSEHYIMSQAHLCQLQLLAHRGTEKQGGAEKCLGH